MSYSEILNGSYTEEVECIVAEVEPAEIKNILRESTELLHIERIPRVLHEDAFSPERKMFYLRCAIASKKEKAYILFSSSSSSLAGKKGVLVLKYDHFTHKELLKKAGICEEEYQSKYNKVGGIIHLNLNEDTLKHKEIISKVLYDKIKDCTTVIRKSSNIAGVFRNIEIEHLQGEKCYKTIQKENGLRFSIDYDKVYWNSKLQIERERMARSIHPGDTVCDMFCGVGPFSILALVRGATVYANDLNPASICNFKESIALNRKALGISTTSKIWNDKIENRVFLYNLDAAEFLLRATKEYNHGTEAIRLFSHYILNLPELTLQYLKGFVGLERKAKEMAEGTKAYVHAYFFVHTNECPIACVESAMERKITCTKRLVRKVSPSKEMWLVVFELVCGAGSADPQILTRKRKTQSS
ncbi:tRNA (guanine37-N1)-methyltransferase [Nematocida sp. AWRm77]|nr:tRNA (guanine37-N1)-methyltransferase [Nematocida sp. AWRm77]